jgi:hypothetical protein
MPSFYLRMEKDDRQNRKFKIQKIKKPELAKQAIGFGK